MLPRANLVTSASLWARRGACASRSSADPAAGLVLPGALRFCLAAARVTRGDQLLDLGS